MKKKRKMAAPGWLKSFAKKQKIGIEGKSSGALSDALLKQKIGTEGKSSGALSDAVRESVAVRTPVDVSAVDDYLADELIQDAAHGDEERSLAKRERARRAPPEPLPPLKERMRVELEKGLKAEIDERNIGFKMLEKMGFKQGKGIGKDGAGTAMPLDIHVRAAARAGLGKEEEVHQLAEEQFQRQAAEANEMRATFLARQRSTFETKQVLRDVIKGRQACEALDRPLGLHNPHLYPEVPPEKSLFTDADTGEQLFTAPNGQTYSRPLRTSPDDRIGGGVAASATARGGSGTGVFFGDSDRSAEELVVIRDDVVRHLRDMHRYCLACAGTFDSRECFEAHVTQSDDCFQMMQGGRGGAGGAPPGGWAPAQEEVDLDFDD